MLRLLRLERELPVKHRAHERSLVALQSLCRSGAFYGTSKFPVDTDALSMARVVCLAEAWTSYQLEVKMSYIVSSMARLAAGPPH